MHIEFAQVDQEYIRQSVKLGYYRSEAEAVRDAVRRAREDAESKRERLLAALRIGDADIAAGRTMPYTPELFQQIMQDALKHAADGRKPNPDVIP
jgi:Arc/MetJ-type ribon-helix-helix transcriptional regulator